MRGSDVEKLQNLADPLAKSMGLEVLKIEFSAERCDSVLRMYLDKAEGGVTVEDCEIFSRNLGPILDVEGDMPARYHLEVSSPGLNRPLASPKHFQAQIGKIVDLRTEEPIEGRRQFKGELMRVVDDDAIVVQVDGKDYAIPLSGIKKAHLDYFASEERDAAAKGRKTKKNLAKD